jgi:hypothetical protein
MTGAVKTQGSTLSIETTLAATKAISAITAANPPVVTATSHGYTNGQIVKLDNIVGMVELNKRAVVVANITTSTFECKGVDGTAYTAYVSGGDSYLATMTAVGTVEGMPTLFAGSAATIDTTHMKSVQQESIAGLRPAGTCSIGLIKDDADAGQLAMQAAADSQAEKVFTVTKSSGKVAAFVAFVTSFAEQAPKNEVYRATADLLLRVAASRFA